MNKIILKGKYGEMNYKLPYLIKNYLNISAVT